MADNRPYRPLAANIQVMQRTSLVQARVGGVRILHSLVAENNFFARSYNHGQPSRLARSEISVPQERLEFNIEPARTLVAVSRTTILDSA